MVFRVFVASLALAASLVSAYTQPTGNAPEGNPISEPGLNSVVPAGEPFIVTWEPTTKGTVTLVLLKGPSSNAVPQYAIVEKTPNSGTYSWTPSTDLAPGQTGYGIQLIDDATGQYQYTTQFGISNPDYQASSSSSAPASNGWPTFAGDNNSPTSAGSTTAVWPAVSGAPSPNSTWSTGNTTMTKPTTASSRSSLATGTGSTVKPANVTMTAPGVYTPTPKTTLTSVTSAALSTTSSAPVHTGGAAAAAKSFAGLALAAGAAVLVL